MYKSFVNFGVPTIQGDAAARNWSGWADIASFEADPAANVVRCVMGWEGLTPYLFMALENDKRFDRVTFEFTRPNRNTQEELYYRLTLQDVMIEGIKATESADSGASSAEHHGQQSDAHDMAVYTLRFKKLTTYQEAASKVPADSWAKRSTSPVLANGIERH